MELFSYLNNDLEDLLEQLANWNPVVESENYFPNNIEASSAIQLNQALAKLGIFYQQIARLNSQVRLSLQQSSRTRENDISINLYANSLRRLLGILERLVCLLERIVTHEQHRFELPRDMFIPASSSFQTSINRSNMEDDAVHHYFSVARYWLQRLPLNISISGLVELKEIEWLNSIRLSDILDILERKEQSNSLSKIQRLLINWVNSRRSDLTEDLFSVFHENVSHVLQAIFCLG